MLPVKPIELGHIDSNYLHIALVTIEPWQLQDLKVGDIVLSRVKGRRYFHIVLHLIIRREADMFLIGNNHGRIDGWVTSDSIFGKVTNIEQNANAEFVEFHRP